MWKERKKERKKKRKKERRKGLCDEIYREVCDKGSKIRRGSAQPPT